MASVRTSLQQRLLAAQGPDGGFSERPGGAFRPEATAWAALALAEGVAARAGAGRACERLAAAQRPDGSVPVAAGRPETSWPTALCLLAWQACGAQAQASDRAAGYLLSLEGARANRQEYPQAGHDVSLAGWPWTVGTHSWVEPTALAVLALRRAGPGADSRVTEGVRLLLDRRLSGGGWNYGNTTVFGTELAPQPDATGVALTALAGVVTEGTAARGLALLERGLGGLSTPVSLSWALIALARWGRAPDAPAAVEGALALEERFGGYGTTACALLAVAAAGGSALAA